MAVVSARGRGGEGERSGRWWSAALRYISQHSYGIFLVHLLVLRHAVHPLLPPLDIRGASVATSLGIIILSWAGALAGSLLFVSILVRWRFARPLVTNRW